MAKVHGTTNEKRREKGKEISGRERGTEQNRKIVWFIYSAPSNITKSIEKWLAVTRSISDDRDLLF